MGRFDNYKLDITCVLRNNVTESKALEVRNGNEELLFSVTLAGGFITIRDASTQPGVYTTTEAELLVNLLLDLLTGQSRVLEEMTEYSRKVTQQLWRD